MQGRKSSMPDELASLLPAVSLTGAMFGTWLTATRDHVDEAIKARYHHSDDPESAVTLGLRLVWISFIVPIAVLVILLPVAIEIILSINIHAEYSAMRAFFFVVEALWIFLLGWAGRNAWKVQSNARSVDRDRASSKN